MSGHPRSLPVPVTFSPSPIPASSKIMGIILKFMSTPFSCSHPMCGMSLQRRKHAQTIGPWLQCRKKSELPMTALACVQDLSHQLHGNTVLTFYRYCSWLIFAALSHSRYRGNSRSFTTIYITVSRTLYHARHPQLANELCGGRM